MATGAQNAVLQNAGAGPIVLNDGFDGTTAAQALMEGRGAAVSFGRHYIGNPDLVHRLRGGLPLAGFDAKALYTPGPIGYVDYPRIDSSER